MNQIRGSLAEFYTQKIEKFILKMDRYQQKMHYKLHFYDIMIIHNTDRINVERILLHINNIHENLTFKLNLGNNNTILFLQFTVIRKEFKFHLGVNGIEMKIGNTNFNRSSNLTNKNQLLSYIILTD